MEDHAGHRERLRQRFRQAGLDGFAPHEALELLLCYAIPRRDVKPLAHALIRRFGSLQAVLGASMDDLTAVPGIGDSAATLIALLLPMMRLYQQGPQDRPEQLADPARRLRYCRALMLGERYERLYLLALDHGGRLITRSLISSGDEGGTSVYPRLIVAALLRAGAAQALLCHNHPGGSPQPSQADRQLTQALLPLLEPLQVRLLDHVIVGSEDAFSFREAGLLPL